MPATATPFSLLMLDIDHSASNDSLAALGRPLPDPKWPASGSTTVSAQLTKWLALEGKSLWCCCQRPTWTGARHGPGALWEGGSHGPDASGFAGVVSDHRVSVGAAPCAFLPLTRRP